MTLATIDLAAKRAEIALDALLLTAWGLFNRIETGGTLSGDARAEALDSLRRAHEALDAAAGSGPTFPHAMFSTTGGGR